MESSIRNLVDTFKLKIHIEFYWHIDVAIRFAQNEEESFSYFL